MAIMTARRKPKRHKRFSEAQVVSGKSRNRGVVVPQSGRRTGGSVPHNPKTFRFDVPETKLKGLQELLREEDGRPRHPKLDQDEILVARARLVQSDHFQAIEGWQRIKMYHDHFEVIWAYFSGSNWFFAREDFRNKLQYMSVVYGRRERAMLAYRHGNVTWEHKEKIKEQLALPAPSTRSPE